MKKIILISLIACGLGLSSCVNEVEEVFDNPASQRLEERMNECKNLLTSAQHGWMIQYFPSPEQSYGGSTYAAKFDASGNVTVAGEIALLLSDEVTETVTSHYSINSSSSVVLSFDTYNKYIHYWSDPDEWYTNRFEGEFEFAYVSGDKNRLIFRGIKTDNKVVFTALDKDIVASARKTAAVEVAVADGLYLGYRCSVEGTDTGIVLYDDDVFNLLTYYPDGDQSGEYIDYPYAYTEEGISFYEPVTMEGITVQNFKWENETFVSTDAVDAAGKTVHVTLAAFRNSDFMHFDHFIGNYSLSVNGVPTPVTLARTPQSVTYKNRSLVLHGLGDYDLNLTYSKSDGSLSLTTQFLGMSGNLFVWLCPWDAAEGYLTWNTGIGFKIIHNGDPDNLVLTFQDNGVWGSYQVNSIIYGTFSEYKADGETRVGNIDRFAYLETMTKQ
ncbi:DUF4302 domain-containing protein [Alistipes sp.]|uniref:DUF4302 domain-containing protein n=1 Tax=Alistipes sp. TaxID=1872444 RepID=UPI003AEF96E2